MALQNQSHILKDPQCARPELKKIFL